MTKILIEGTLLGADAGKREIQGIVLPYGEVGHTNVGQVIASKGCIDIADDVTFNIEHDFTRPIGRMTASEETDKGLVCTFKVSSTTAGNDLLAEAADGLRTGLSVEVEDPYVDDKGRLTGGLLTAVGAVVRPAFTSARIERLAAAMKPKITETLAASSIDVSPDTTLAEIISAISPQEVADTVVDPAVDAEEVEASEVVDEPVVVKAARPVTPVRTKRSMKASETKNALFDALQRQDFAMLATISEATNTSIGQVPTQDQWLGELWSGRRYQRKFVPLLANGPLTSWKVRGYKWTDEGLVDDYTGDISEVPSGPVDVEEYTATAFRLAGGNSFDRKFVDFNDTEFLDGYFRRMTDNYARKSDAKALAFINSSAPNVSPGSVPSGVSGAAAAIVDAAMAVNQVGTASFAIVDEYAFRDLALTKKDNTLEYLKLSLGIQEDGSGTFDGFSIVTASGLALGEVIVGDRQAARFLELAGSPIRVNALQVLNGAVDESLYGYFLPVLDDAEGFASVTQTVSAVVVKTGAFAMTVGDDNKTLSVEVTFVDGSKVLVPSTNGSVTLNSATPAKATVVAGQIHPVAAGTSAIKATVGGVDSVTVTATIS